MKRKLLSLLGSTILAAVSLAPAWSNTPHKPDHDTTGHGAIDMEVPPDLPPDLPNRKTVHIVTGSPSDFTHDTTDVDTSIFADSGVSLVRIDIKWDKVENPTKGNFRWSGTAGGAGQVFDYDYYVIQCHDRGVKLFFTVINSPGWSTGGGQDKFGPPDDMDDFADFVTAILARYKPGGSLSVEKGWPATDRTLYALEFWGEPNNGTAWAVWNGSNYVQALQPDRYAEMSNKANIAAKAEDPGILTVSASICSICQGPGEAFVPFMNAMAAAGFVGLDAFGLNGYYGAGGTPRQVMNQPINSTRNFLNGIGASGTRIWILEAGAGVTGCVAGKEDTQVGVLQSLLGAPPFATSDLDFWRATFGVDRVTWTLFFDTSASVAGLVRYQQTWPIATGPCPTAGAAKLAYAAFKILPSVF